MSFKNYLNEYSGVSHNKRGQSVNESDYSIANFLDYHLYYVDKIFALVRENLGDTVGSFAKRELDIGMYVALREYKLTQRNKIYVPSKIEVHVSDAADWISDYLRAKPKTETSPALERRLAA